MDTPLERPGRTVEVEGRLEEEEALMTGWSQVRRKKGQVETDVVARSRGREENQTEKGQVETDVVAGSRGWEEYSGSSRTWLSTRDEGGARGRR